MKFNLQLTAIAALLGASGVAQAALTTSSVAANFNGSAVVTATRSYPNQGPTFSNPPPLTTSNDGAVAANAAVGQFDAATGVLIDAQLVLSSNRQAALAGGGYKNNGAGKTMTGSGSSTAALLSAGVSETFLPVLDVSGGSCSLASGSTGSISCSWAAINSPLTATNTNASVSSASLDSYVGNGNVTASMILPSFSATTDQSEIAGQASGSNTSYTVNWSGSLQANYNYLLHALASFDGGSASNTLTLDFGNVAQNSVAALAFSLYNLGNADRIGLDLDGFSASGDSTAFTTDLSGFANLAQGGSQAFTANLLTANVGAFSAQYLLNLSDADLGATTSRYNHQLTLNLIGNVTAVPLPAAVWSFFSGLMGLLALHRRKARGFTI